MAGDGLTPRGEEAVKRAAELVARYDSLFVGVGIAGRCAVLAQRLNPALTVVFESGIVGAALSAPPRSISDRRLYERCRYVAPQEEIFDCWLGGRRIDAAVVGAAQVDLHGRVNTTVIGSYAAPRARLTGAGGAPEVRPRRAAVVLLAAANGRVVESVDFVTYRLPDDIDRWLVTDLGVWHARSGEQRLVAVTP
ncbi:MAG: CoA-transferase subunit beta [Candidatus Eremiobacteraeota bacterium]|nr:CoA-transferase subunit beta [Candidatus Eremiobacteraeota bacterium]